MHNLCTSLTLASLWENLPISLWFITRSEPRVSDLGGAPPTPSSNIGVKAWGSLMYTFKPCFWTLARQTVRACSVRFPTCTPWQFLPWAPGRCICEVLVDWAGRNTWRSGNLQTRRLLLHWVQSAFSLTTWTQRVETRLLNMEPVLSLGGHFWFHILWDAWNRFSHFPQHKLIWISI